MLKQRLGLDILTFLSSHLPTTTSKLKNPILEVHNSNEVEFITILKSKKTLNKIKMVSTNEKLITSWKLYTGGRVSMYQQT
jgi:hypothetical protein